MRQQLFKLLRVLPEAEIRNHADQLLLYTRAGMTHLAAEIRSYALDVLEWLLRAAGEEVVGCAGGWAKTLRCFLCLLGWQSDAASASDAWSAPRTSFSQASGDAKVQAKQLNAFAAFLRAGLLPPPEESCPADAPRSSFPLCHVQHHMLPQRCHAFASLNLFGAPRDDETEMYEDREDRLRVFRDKVEPAVVAGVEHAKRGGGELGRAAAQVRKVMAEASQELG